MAQYPPKLTDRFPHVMAALQRRVTKLESRTAGIDSGMPLAALPAVVDPAYTSGDPKVLINGSAVLSGPYSHLASYTPAANDSVLVLPLPVTAVISPRAYVVLGKMS